MAGQAKFEDSNIALFGSDVEKQVHKFQLSISSVAAAKVTDRMMATCLGETQRRQV